MNMPVEDARKLVKAYINSKRVCGKQLTVKSAKIYSNIAADLLIEHGKNPGHWQDVKSKIEAV